MSSDTAAEKAERAKKLLLRILEVYLFTTTAHLQTFYTHAQARAKGSEDTTGIFDGQPAGKCLHFSSPAGYRSDAYLTDHELVV